MEDRDKKLLKAYAAHNMNVRETGDAVYLHYNSICYRFRLIQREGGVDPVPGAVSKREKDQIREVRHGN